MTSILNGNEIKFMCRNKIQQIQVSYHYTTRRHNPENIKSHNARNQKPYNKHNTP
jgi:hypothetical protein